jgi:CelD/BcsL family acetyltransferase involved in cellulose biosynthesis
VAEQVGRVGGRLGIRSWHIGTAGESPADTVFVESNRLLVLPQYRQSFATALLRALHREKRWDELVLDGFVPEDADAMLSADPGLTAVRVASPTTDLSLADQGGDVLAVLKATTRQKVRRSLRGFGSVQTEWAADQLRALDILDDLATLHARRWQRAGRPGMFVSRRFNTFHRALIERLLPAGRAILFRARSDGHTIGCLYCLVDGDAVLFYQSGFEHFEDNHLKPGLLTHALCMQACWERGFRTYNLLAGNERYKHELATMQGVLVWALRRRRRPKLFVLEVVRRLRGRARSAGPSAKAIPPF